MAILRQQLPPLLYLPSIHFHSSSPKPCLFHLSKTLRLFSLYSSPPSPSPSLNSSPSIFLPFLEDQEEECLDSLESVSVEEEEEEEEGPQDPIVRFLKSRALTEDPQIEGKLSLQKNRRTSWHLAELLEDSKPVSEPDPVSEPSKPQLGRASSDSNPSRGGVVDQILDKARNLGENLTLGEELGGFEGKIGEKECVEVLELMGKEEGLLRSCLHFYEWMSLQEEEEEMPCGGLVSPRACSVLFPILGRGGMGEQVLVLFQNLPMDRKEFRDVRVYNAAISGLMCSKRYDDAWKVYERMEANNILPDHVTCSIMITIMRKIGRSAKDSWDFFERMNRKGVKWSQEVLGALIKSFCDEGLKSQALIIQIEMEKKGISSNAIVYNTLMTAFCDSNRVEEAEGLFAEMKSKRIKPTTPTFNILMDAYSRRMQPEIVEKLLVEMQEMGLEPNVKSYTCLVSAYGRQKNMSDMAADAFLRMKKFGIRPTSHTYTALIHAYSVSGWHEKAYIEFENMQREGLKPSIETYTALLDAFRRAGDTEMLMKIWKLMLKEKVQGTKVTFNTLLDGFSKQGHYLEARDVVSEFGNMGLQPTVMTYNMLMNAYARGGQHSKLPQLLKEMEVLNLKPDSVTYSTMIYAYIRVRDFSRAFFYHKKMVKSGQVPDVRSYEKMRAILDVKLARKNKKDKSAILGIINSKMGMLKIKKKVKKDEFWKTKKKRYVRADNAAKNTNS